MISFTNQQTLFGDLSQNTSASNLARGAYLANIEHRYLLQKFFSNEGSFQTTTVGAQTLTATTTLTAGALSLTLTSPWAYYTTQAWITFSSGDYRKATFTAGSTSVTWQAGLSANATATLSLGGLQFYPAPPNYSKLKTITITIGNLQWTLTEVLSRDEWDRLNVFPYYADIPKNFFVYPGGDHGVQIGIWPIPSTTGNLITYNYKFRVPDLSLVDYTGGTVSVNNGSTTVTGVGTSFIPTTNAVNESRWIQFSQPSGDNLWYQIATVNSSTSITLYQPYQGINISGSSNYTIGQMPLLMEDFQDMLVWKPLIFYFSSIVDNPNKKKEFEGLYAEKLEQLKEYAGNNTINVNLARKGLGQNPNLYPQSIGN